jgi:hypothetical protein
MAKIYATDLTPPEWNPEIPWQEYDSIIKVYEDTLAAMAREANPDDELAGEVVRFGIADGKASYMVFRSKPLELIHLDYDHGYALPEFSERGLRLSDIRERVEFERRWQKLPAAQKGVIEDVVLSHETESLEDGQRAQA